MEFFQLNEGSVTDPFVLWNARKSYMRRMFIKLGARTMRKRQQLIDHLFTEIRQHEAENTSNPDPALSTKLTNLQRDFHTLLLEKFDRNSRCLKMTYYTSGNKANKLLARHLQGYRNKTKIFYVYHPFTKQKVLNP